MEKNGFMAWNVEKTRQQQQRKKRGRKEFSYERYNKIVYETCDPKKEGKEMFI